MSIVPSKIWIQVHEHGNSLKIKVLVHRNNLKKTQKLFNKYSIIIPI